MTGFSEIVVCCRLAGWQPLQKQPLDTGLYYAAYAYAISTSPIVEALGRGNKHELASAIRSYCPVRTGYLKMHLKMFLLPHIHIPPDALGMTWW